MKFNVDKCKLLHVGQKNGQADYTIQGGTKLKQESPPPFRFTKIDTRDLIERSSQRRITQIIDGLHNEEYQKRIEAFEYRMDIGREKKQKWFDWSLQNDS